MKKRFVPLMALASMTLGLLAPLSAQGASGGTHARVVAVAASDDWLVYKRQVSSTNLTPDPQEGDVLYATDAAGRATRLADFHGAATSGVSLVGDVLVQATRTSDRSVFQQRVRYRDLSSGATAQVTGKVDDDVVSAAPGGWVVLRAGQTGPSSEFGLIRVRPDGTETDLGVPFPDYVDGGVGYRLETSGSGLIASPIEVDDQCTGSQVRFQPWSDPGGWRTVFVGASRSCIECAPASTSSVACRVTRPAKGLVVISLRGGAPHYLRNSSPKRCQTVDYATSRDDLVAIETTDAGACTKGEVYRFGQNKKVATSTGRYSARASIRVGLGRILVGKGQQQVVYGLTGVTRTPKTVARA